MAHKVIIFYDDDPDGFGAAWSAWRKYKNNAKYVVAKRFMLAKQLRREKISGLNVFFLDLCPDAESLSFARKKGANVVVIDHHKTSMDVIKLLPGSICILTHSACVLAWKYFHPRKPVPNILKCVEDNDLWRFRYGTKELLLSLSWKYDFAHWNRLARLIDDKSSREEYIEKGRLILSYQSEAVRCMAEGADLVTLAGYRAFAVNGPRCFNSQIGNYLAHFRKGVHIGIVFYYRDQNRYIRFSLRSDGTVDVSKIAERFGGGGHHDSAAFQVPVNGVWPLKIKKS